MFVGSNNSIGTLKQKRLDIRPGTIDPGVFFLSGALIVLRRKSSHEQRCFAVGNRTYRRRFSDNTIAEKDWMPGTDETRPSCGRNLLAMPRIVDSRFSLQVSSPSMWARIIRSFSACSGTSHRQPNLNFLPGVCSVRAQKEQHQTILPDIAKYAP